MCLYQRQRQGFICLYLTVFTSYPVSSLDVARRVPPIEALRVIPVLSGLRIRVTKVIHIFPSTTEHQEKCICVLIRNLEFPYAGTLIRVILLNQLCIFIGYITRIRKAGFIKTFFQKPVFILQCLDF